MKGKEEGGGGGARTRSSNLRSPLVLELVFVDDSRGIQQSASISYLIVLISLITLRFFVVVVVIARSSRLFHRPLVADFPVEEQSSQVEKFPGKTAHQPVFTCQDLLDRNLFRNWTTLERALASYWPVTGQKLGNENGK